MNSIKIHEIKESVCNLYDPKDQLIGVLTSECQFNDIRIQLMEQNLDGYYVIWNNGKNDVRIDINRFGRVDNWPEDFYNIQVNQCYTILRGAMDRSKKERKENKVDS